MLKTELLLFSRNKSWKLLFFMVLTLSIASSWLAKQQYQTAKTKVIHYYQSYIDQFEATHQELDKNWKALGLTLEEYQAEIHFYQSYIDDYRAEKNAAQSEDWNYFYTKNIREHWIDGKYSDVVYEQYQIAPETIENTVLVSRYLKKHQLPTAFPTGFFLTIFDQPRNPADQELLVNIGKQQLKGTSHEVWKWQKETGTFLLPVISLVCFSNFFIKDNQHSNRQRRLLRTAGLSNQRILQNKMVAFFILFSIVFLTTHLLVLLTALMINGHSSWLYPITTYTFLNPSSFVGRSSINLTLKPIYQIVLNTLFLQYLYCLFIVGFSQVMTRFFKNTLIGSIFSLGLTLGATLYPSPWNPFSFWRVATITDGSLIAQTNQVNYTTPQATITLLLSIFSLYALYFFLNPYLEKEV